MKYVKTPDEFDKLKQKMLKKLIRFIDDYEEFSKYTSPSSWRLSGHHFMELKNLKKDLIDTDRIKSLTMKDLENEFVRDEIFTDEEKELWDATTKYNL
jgi:hypothetical protein